ncbi:MAG TPA: hypothetical protein VND70_08795 [Acidimicrobiales bacterium]|nr:hypothetical protein [Acidimicrobiales bacterium]
MTLHPPEVANAQAPAPTRPARNADYSLRPAMIVLGLAVLILGAFIAAGFLTSNPVQGTRITGSSAVPGSTLVAVPAATALSVITRSGQPPGNILNAVSIPRGAVRTAHQDNTAAADQYDAQVSLRANTSQGALEAFYAGAMRQQGWQVFGRGPASHDPGAFEILGKRAGSDGFYWELGAVIGPTSFGTGAPAAGSTDFTLRLFQVPDPA